MSGSDDQLTETKQIIRGAIYARYSSEMQAATSARDQIERIKRLAEKGQIESRTHKGAKVKISPDWIKSDEAMSGKVASRKGYQEIQDGIRQKAFDLIIVDDLSRLTRSLGNLIDLYQLLKHHDVELISISDRVSSEDPNAKTLFTMKGMVADFGNEAHSERTLRGLEARAQGLFSTGQKPYGFRSESTETQSRKGRPVPSHFKILLIPEQAEVIRRIFELYASGYGKKYIAKTLNQEGVPSCKRKTSGWNEGMIFNLLKNEKYIGRWVYRKNTYSINPDTGKRSLKPLPREKWIVTTREDLRIISQECWEKVQEQLSENKKVKREGKTKKQQLFGVKRSIADRHLLSGTMICADCGMGVAVVSGRNKGYYGCIAAHRQGTCGTKYLLPLVKIETAFINYLHQKIIGNDRVIAFATDCYNRTVKEFLKKAPSRKGAAEKEINSLQGEIQNLVQFIAGGKASDVETIAGAIRERESRLAKLNQELSRLCLSQITRPIATPFMVRERISGFIGNIINRGEKHRETVKALLHGPMVVSCSENRVMVRGQLNLGTTIGCSIQDQIARPA